MTRERSIAPDSDPVADDSPADDAGDDDAARAAADAAIAAHVDALAAEVAAYGSDAQELVAGLRRSVEGGKRLRPAFVHWTWRAVGEATGTPDGKDGPPPQRVGASTVARVGAAVELFQAAALVHDDVMDRSHTRRGRPAAHRAFAELHDRSGWHGPADAFGESAAILLGDLALIASERQLARTLVDVPPDVASRVRAVFDLMRTEVTVGQYLDVLGQALPWGEDPAADESRARAVIRSKSARYSIEHPMVLGAALAGGDAADLALAGEVGGRLGEAFQLRDDVLGVFGDPERTGKPAGDDLREGKHTVLVARAYAHADTGDRALLRTHLGDRDLDDGGVERLRQVIRRSGALDQIEDLITGLADEAFGMLSAAPWGVAGRRGLERLGAAAVERSR